MNLQTEHLYLPCTCHDPTHGLFVEATHWPPDDGPAEFDIGFCVHLPQASLGARLRWAWRVLCGQDVQHEVCLHEAGMVHLAEFIWGQVKVLKWRELQETAVATVAGTTEFMEEK